MDNNELYKAYLKVLNERANLENKIEEFINRWKNGDTTLNNEQVQALIDKGYERLEKLRKEENRLHEEYLQSTELEKNIQAANISIEHHLGTRPTQYEINSGVLSSNGEESHLIAKEKTEEQLEQEKNQLLEDIKRKVQQGEISLSEASNLVNNINFIYGSYENNEESELKR